LDCCEDNATSKLFRLYILNERTSDDLNCIDCLVVRVLCFLSTKKKALAWKVTKLCENSINTSRKSNRQIQQHFRPNNILWILTQRYFGIDCCQHSHCLD
jgi:hypothetical protein